MNVMLVRFRTLLVLLLAAALLAACATNPVTGRNELRLISEQEEIQLGRENYMALRQMQGGDYTVDPGLSEYVNEVGQRLVSVSHRPQLPFEFVVVNNSVPNAWALPGGKIGINRGLLVELESEAELAAVLGHEVVHATARHSAQRIERGLMMQAGIAAIGIGTDSDSAVTAAAIGSVLLTQHYSRDAEFEADRYGMQYMQRAGYNPHAAVDLQQTFVRLSEDEARNWLNGLFASHPPSQERVEANRRYADELGGDGDYGRQRYQETIARLLESRDAYAAFDDGREALSDGDTDTALELARKALAAEPNEALFHGLQADALRLRQDHRSALQHYQRAKSHNDEFFAFYLGSGLSRRALGDRSGAIRDLERSNQLLPTEVATNALSELSNM